MSKVLSWETSSAILGGEQMALEAQTRTPRAVQGEAGGGHNSKAESSPVLFPCARFLTAHSSKALSPTPSDLKACCTGQQWLPSRARWVLPFQKGASNELLAVRWHLCTDLHCSALAAQEGLKQLHADHQQIKHEWTTTHTHTNMLYSCSEPPPKASQIHQCAARTELSWQGSQAQF